MTASSTCDASLHGSGLTCVARVYGGGALGLVLAPLQAAGIWTSTDLPHGTTMLSDRAIALGGTRVMVLDHDAQDAFALLESLPPITSSGLKGWRMLAFLVILFQAAAPCSPFAVFLQRRASVAVAQQADPAT